MAKTIRELSEQFGVSKQAINKRLTADFRRQYVTTKPINGITTLLVDKNGEKLLSKAFNTDNEPTIDDNKDYELVFDLLSKQVNQQKQELEAKNKQIETMQKLLDQSQQLQLMAEKKIEESQKIDLAEKQASDKPTKKWWQFR